VRAVTLALAFALAACNPQGPGAVGPGSTSAAGPGAVGPGTGGPGGGPGNGGPGGGPGETGRPASTPFVDDRIALRFFPQAIADPAAENRIALTFLVPDGWSYDAGVEWMPEWSRIAFLRTRVSDPATGTTVSWLPIQDFIWFEAPAGAEAPIGGNYQGKMYVPPVFDPAQFVADFWTSGALAHLQGLRPVTVTELPRIADEFKLGFGGPADAAAYRLRYEFPQAGQVWQEDVSFALLYSGGGGITNWYVNFAHTVRAPKGELDRLAGVTSTIISSRMTTDEWGAIYRLVQQLFNQGIQQQMNDTVAFGRTLAEHRAATEALQAQVTAERQASQDRIAELRRETLGGIETYSDPFTGSPVQLPVGFGTYWVNQQGEYVTSDQVGFDPNTLNQGFWQQLQRSR
jgi:hypothetical protein